MDGIKIGLEVHIQLNTDTKLFCQCHTEISNPNENTCEICLGFPGAKPLLNEKAVELALKIAVALDSKINKVINFSRKTYFYPDLAKNFQITQYELPISTSGKLKVLDRVVRIKRIHIEEDPAKIIRKNEYTLIDYNRSGIPLVEIVTEPDIRSPREARIFLQNLQQLLEFIYVCDFSREGSMRVDANISISKYREKYDYIKSGNIVKKVEGARVEIKNISGIKEVEKALNYEILRQKNLKEVKRETRVWNEKTKITDSAREKEFEEDYGYIFEPNLCIFEIKDELVNKIYSNLPELPEMKRQRYLKYGLSEEIVNTLLSEPELSHYFEYLCETHNEKVNVEIRYLRRIIDLLQEYLITDDIAEFIIREMVSDYTKGKTIRDPDRILRDMKYTRPLDEEKLRKFVRDVIRENGKAVMDYKKGEKKAFDYLIGQVMKKAGRRGNIKHIIYLLKHELD